MEEQSIGMVMRPMCEECDAFLGKEHKLSCTHSGLVEDSQATEKMTTLDRAEEENPILGLDLPTAKLLRAHLTCKSDHPDYDDVLKLKEGLDLFLESAD